MIPSMQSRNVISLEYTPGEIGKHKATVHIRTSESTMMITTKIHVKRQGVEVFPHVLDFGVFSDKDIPYSITLYASNKS